MTNASPPSLLRRLAAGLSMVTALVAAGSLLAAVPQPVINTAHLSWVDAGQSDGVDSNTVTIEVAQDRATLTAYLNDAGSALRTALYPSLCGGSLAQQRPPAAPAPASNIGIAPTRIVPLGAGIVFELDSAAANIRSNAVDAVEVVLTTPGGDRETLVAYENGPDTGKFVGSIATQAVPPAPVAGDCALGIAAGDRITIEARSLDGARSLATTTLDAVADPLNVIFDSEDGTPVSGATISLIDDVTGQPATVYAPDGVTPWPATVQSGQPITDSGGTHYDVPAGEYRFPLAPPGRYRLKIMPPAPYTAPSTATAAALAGLSHPEGGALAINDGSYGLSFTLAQAGPVRADIPLDRPAAAIVLSKTASRVTASPGDIVLYTVVASNPDAAHAKRDVTVTDILPAAMRLRPGSVRIDGFANPAAVVAASDGTRLTVSLGALPAAGARTITYALDVRPDARDGQAINRATATDSRGLQGVASAVVRISGETIASRMTVIGRVIDATCDTSPPLLLGVGGIRVMLEDGSYTITDPDGRYHFEGVLPGTHVVQVDSGTLPAGARFVDCVRSTRSAGSAISRFVEGQGGSLVVADFHAALDKAAAPVAAVDAAIPVPATDKVAAGAERDWFANGSATVAWLFPDADYNPRAPAIRVAIRHVPGQTVVLSANGKPVDPITSDGQRTDATRTFAISLWRGVPLTEETTNLSAEVRNADGSLATTLTRAVHFVTTAARGDFVPDRSRLVADGVQRPVVAVRIVDRAGRPLHAGSTGSFALSAPYQPAAAIDAEQARVLSGLERAAPVWRVAGDDGIAYIALAPTTTSGALTLDFTFRDRDQARTQRIDAWLSPGNRPWTIVGLAEGRIGHHALGSHVEPLAGTSRDIETDGRIAFYAKGRILGRWLLTLAYDSKKRREDQLLGGAIDPNTYYTVYADRSERRYDAASTRKIYVKLESRQFYALFGDFETGFGDTMLGRYIRSATGGKAEYRGRHIAASAFAATIATSHRRDEIQGNGLTGPYALGARDVLANSEQVTIEVRDRLRSEQILETKTLTRFVDYDIDYALGTLRFSSPVLSRSSALDPQFIVVDYEVDSLSGGATNAGARATYTTTDGKVRVGATVLHDASDDGRTNLGAADARIRLGAKTEVRAEIAASRQEGTSHVDTAWLVEAEHHDDTIDVLAYARQLGADYGVAQQNTAERGRRKIGIDGRVHLTSKLSASASAWTDDDLLSAANRRAIAGHLEYRTGKTDLSLGITHAEDRTDAVPSAVSTLVEAAATQRLFGNRLELDAASSFALGHAASVDFPARQRIGARFQVTPGVALTGAYEIANGDAVSARTARIGFDLKPWAGAHLTTSIANQGIREYGRRAYAAYGLAQSLPIDKHWTVDATLDGTRTLGGFDVTRIVNPAQPVASGGFVGSGGIVTEDFTALTLGATYRGTLWSATGRGEYRFGQLGDRAGANFGLIRQLGAGSTLGALASWSKVGQKGAATTETFDLAISGAVRPAKSAFAVLGKVEFRSDRVTNAVIGGAGPVPGTVLNVSGDALSRRLVASVSADWAPYGRDAHGLYQRTEVSLFAGTRYVFDRIDSYDLAGLTTMLGADGRIGLGQSVELGLTGTLRGNIGQGNFGYAYGPTLGVRAAKNALVTLGWNLHGFADRDFAQARTTQLGPFVSLRVKFDQDTFAFLGLARR